MPNSSRLPRWAQRVSRAKILQLYENDALGLLDEELVDQVAYGFSARCQSILEVNEAAAGRVRCPVCHGSVLRQGESRDEKLVCEGCGWSVVWGRYHDTYRRRHLLGGGATPFFVEYTKRLEQTHSAAERMLLIDWMVHQCHESIQRGAKEMLYGRPAAMNLIDGTMSQVMALLEGLAANASTAEMQQHRALWRERVLSGFGERQRWMTEHGREGENEERG